MFGLQVKRKMLMHFKHENTIGRQTEAVCKKIAGVGFCFLQCLKPSATVYKTNSLAGSSKMLPGAQQLQDNFWTFPLLCSATCQV